MDHLLSNGCPCSGDPSSSLWGSKRVCRPPEVLQAASSKLCSQWQIRVLRLLLVWLRNGSRKPKTAYESPTTGCILPTWGLFLTLKGKCRDDSFQDFFSCLMMFGLWPTVSVSPVIISDIVASHCNVEEHLKEQLVESLQYQRLVSTQHGIRSLSSGAPVGPHFTAEKAEVFRGSTLSQPHSYPECLALEVFQICGLSFSWFTYNYEACWHDPQV